MTEYDNKSVVPVVSHNSGDVEVPEPEQDQEQFDNSNLIAGDETRRPKKSRKSGKKSTKGNECKQREKSRKPKKRTSKKSSEKTSKSSKKTRSKKKAASNQKRKKRAVPVDCLDETADGQEKSAANQSRDPSPDSAVEVVAIPVAQPTASSKKALTIDCLDSIDALVDRSDSIDALVDRPDSVDALVDHPASVDALVDHPDSVDALVDRPGSIDVLVDSTDALVECPDSVDALHLVGRPDSINALVDHPNSTDDFVDRLGSIGALVERPDTTGAVVDRPNPDDALVGRSYSTDALVEHPNSIDASVDCSNPTDAVVDCSHALTPDSIDALVESPENSLVQRTSVVELLEISGERLRSTPTAGKPLSTKDNPNPPVGLTKSSSHIDDLSTEDLLNVSATRNSTEILSNGDSYLSPVLGSSVERYIVFFFCFIISVTNESIRSFSTVWWKLFFVFRDSSRAVRETRHAECTCLGVDDCAGD